MMPAEPMSSLVLVCRLFWMMIGPMMLLMLVLTIGGNGGGWLTRANVAYLVVLGAMVAARWLEFRKGSPLTSTGEPATSADLRRYVLGTLVLGLGVWMIANLFGEYWMT